MKEKKLPKEVGFNFFFILQIKFQKLFNKKVDYWNFFRILDPKSGGFWERLHCL